MSQEIDPDEALKGGRVAFLAVSWLGLDMS